MLSCWKNSINNWTLSTIFGFIICISKIKLQLTIQQSVIVYNHKVVSKLQSYYLN